MESKECIDRDPPTVYFSSFPNSVGYWISHTPEPKKAAGNRSERRLVWPTSGINSMLRREPGDDIRRCLVNIQAKGLSGEIPQHVRDMLEEALRERGLWEQAMQVSMEAPQGVAAKQGPPFKTDP